MPTSSPSTTASRSARTTPRPIDSLSVIHLGEHLERLSAQDLRKLDTQVPLETLRAVVDLATEIGREGREGHPVGTMFVVGDTRKVLTMSRPMNFNPFRGYSHAERDIRNRAVREQIKDIAQLEGAIVIRRDGVAVAAGMRIEAPDTGITLSMGLGTRHAAAASISKATKAHRRRRQPVVGHGAAVPERRGGAAHRVAAAAGDVEPVPHGGPA